MTKNCNNPAVLLFSKIPGLAPCKTRLATSTGLAEDFITNLATAFLADSLELISKYGTHALFATQPEITPDKLARLINKTLKVELALDHLHLFPQTGNSFGQRLQNACEHSHSRHSSGVVVIGSDAPLLSPTTLEYACQIVAAGKFCLGPTPDGGIYLIGLPEIALARDFSLADVFEKKTDTELVSLAEKMSQFGPTLELLEFLFDVDIESDLVTLSSMISALQSAQKTAKADKLWTPRHTTDFLSLHPITASRVGENNRHNSVTGC